ncbi:hypothetical protein [Anaerotignum lactatifermentans]|uniref:hypothetical protein n=1 Tax=Lachnospirales TaxID=3085636 RepID=UPI00399A5324
METYITAIKDILVIIAPIVIAYISYRSNKKTTHDIRLELEKSLKEKDADTTQMLTKINAELESQKQIISWQNSLPRVDCYVNQMDQIRYGNISALPDLTQKVTTYISRNDLPLEELKDIHAMLLKINLPTNETELYPFEIPIMIDFKKMLHTIEEKISSKT